MILNISKSPFIVILLPCFLLLFSCGKSEVKKKFGTYNVIDSVKFDFYPDWIVRSNYQVKVSNIVKRKKFMFTNIGKLNNYESEAEVIAEIDGLEFVINEQLLFPGMDGGYGEKLVKNGTGYFTRDSIFFEMRILNVHDNDEFVAIGSGVKID